MNLTSWMHVGLVDTVYWPSKDMSSRTLSRTETAADSATLNASETTIVSIHVGPGHTAGDLQILQHDGTTLVRELEVPTVGGANMSNNLMVLPFSFPGGFSAEMQDSGGAVDVYIQYVHRERWT